MEGTAPEKPKEPSSTDQILPELKYWNRNRVKTYRLRRHIKSCGASKSSKRDIPKSTNLSKLLGYRFNT